MPVSSGAPAMDDERKRHSGPTHGTRCIGTTSRSASSPSVGAQAPSLSQRGTRDSARYPARSRVATAPGPASRLLVVVQRRSGRASVVSPRAVSRRIELAAPAFARHRRAALHRPTSKEDLAPARSPAFKGDVLPSTPAGHRAQQTRSGQGCVANLRTENDASSGGGGDQLARCDRDQATFGGSLAAA
jgi:hypothetical protein